MVKIGVKYQSINKISKLSLVNINISLIAVEMKNLTISFRENKHQRIPQGQSKMDYPEKLATQGTRDEDKQNKKTTHVRHTNNVNKTQALK